MGYVLLASFLGIAEAILGLMMFDLGWLAALCVWSFGGNLSAVLVMAVCHVWPIAFAFKPVIPEYEPSPACEPEPLELRQAA